jgi:hypothetical protein
VGQTQFVTCYMVGVSLWNRGTKVLALGELCGFGTPG